MIIDQITSLISDNTQLKPEIYLPDSHKLLNTKLFNKKLTINKEENQFYNSRIKNLDLQVYVINDNQPNAFTIVGVDNISLLQSNLHEFQSLGLRTLLKHPLTATRKNGKIIFNSTIKKFKILVFLHSGLFKSVPNIEDRFAIVLHEIGHWVHFRDIISSRNIQYIINFMYAPLPYYSIMTYSIFSSDYVYYFIIHIVRIVLNALFNIKNIKNEYDSDLFTKQMGYSVNLQNALSRIEYNKELSQVNLQDKDSFLSNLIDLFSLLFSKHTHPFTHKRILALYESFGLTDSFIQLLSPIDKIIKLNHGTLCYFR